MAKGMRDVWAEIDLENARKRDDELRELLSYCKTQDGRYLKAYEAYRDVATKLATILDGE